MRKRAANSSLSRQEATPEMMEKFFEELNNVRSPSSEVSDPSKRIKMNPLDVLGVSDAPTTTINLGDIPTTIGGGAELGGENPEQPQPMVTESYETDQPSVRKGGRPKLPLFSVRTSRQKARTAKVMSYIRTFATENQENVDDILWSLLILRVKGSGNTEICNDLDRLYQVWSRFISSVPAEQMQGVTQIQPISIQGAMQGAMQGMAPTQVAQLSGDIVQLQQQAIHPSEGEYPIHPISMDSSAMLEQDQNDIMARV